MLKKSNLQRFLQIFKQKQPENEGSTADTTDESCISESTYHYMQDEVHPNKLGQELYGKVVFAYVEASLK